MAKRGRAGPALATAAIGSFVAGTLATIAADAARAAGGRRRAQVRPDRVFRADGARLRDRGGGARRIHGARPHHAVPGLAVRARRHRRPDRAVALRLRRARAARRHRRRGARRGPVRGRRGALRRVRSEPHRRKSGADVGLAHDVAATTGGARGRPGCAARPSAFRSAPFPPGGAEIPTFLSYAMEKKLSKHPEEFGKGAIEGVAGPEAANNASAPACWCRS